MGTGYSIDTPLRVARYGITSVISLVDDVLIEQMRRHHSLAAGLAYEAIGGREEDARARRITAYLNLLDELVRRQVEALRASPFETGSEITRYFELLPDSSLKQAYRDMLAADPAVRAPLQEELRRRAIPGGIDVNIMTKVDRLPQLRGQSLPSEQSDALSALRGYARSRLRSAIVFSAGLNPRLYAYLSQFDDFFPGADGDLKKRIILKVSDYRSAEVQGRYLAKRGLWVSEYRIESGLNCGGHAFPTNGLLLGPILETFRERRADLASSLHETYIAALASHGRPLPDGRLGIRVTVQGGIGTAGENDLLLNHYRVDGTGWATPFMLVPEVVNVDADTLGKLAAAGEGDVFLSDSSPFGLPFWSLRRSASEESRLRRIAAGRPGADCPKGYVRLNTEFPGEPLCTAAAAYQRRKLGRLPEEDLSDEARAAAREKVLAKACICHDLAGAATLRLGIDPRATPSVCCGPNIVNFSKVATLEEMVGHIYGLLSLPMAAERPHMFLKELGLYIDYLRGEMEKYRLRLTSRSPKDFREFRDNLRAGIDYYRRQAEGFIQDRKEKFHHDLKSLQEELEKLLLAAPADTWA